MQSNILIVEDEYVVSLDPKKHIGRFRSQGDRHSSPWGRCGGKSPIEYPPDLVLMDIQLADKMRVTDAAEHLNDGCACYFSDRLL